MATKKEVLDYKEIFDLRGGMYNQAVKESPHARKEEVMPILNMLELSENDILIDLPSGGGFVSWGISEYLQSSITKTLEIYEVEPSEIFSTQNTDHTERIQGHGTKLECNKPSINFAKLHKVSSPIFQLILPNEIANKVSSLAGLHHLTTEQKTKFFSETFRVLKPGGRIVVADVKAGTMEAKFLNTIVDKLTVTGHCGEFFEENDFSRYLELAGFQEIKEEYIPFHWIFNSDEEMIKFTRNLFGLQNAESMNQIKLEIDNYLSPKIF